MPEFPRTALPLAGRGRKKPLAPRERGGGGAHRICDASARRRLRYRRILLSRAHLAGQGRAASRSLRSGVRVLLQGHRELGGPEGRAPRGLVEETRRAVSDRGG